MDEKIATGAADAKDAPIVKAQLGVWEVLMQDEAALDPMRQWHNLTAALPLLARFLGEIYALGPHMFALFVASKIWSGVESAILLYLSSRLLTLVEMGLKEGQPEAWAIYQAMAARVMCVVVVAIIDWWTERILPKFRTRITTHFELHLMKIKLQVDAASSTGTSNPGDVTASAAWDAFEEIMRYSVAMLTLASQMVFIVQTSRTSGGPLFGLLCVARPLYCAMTLRSLWSRAHIITSTNKFYHRVKALASLADENYRQEVISGNLSEYIITEYNKAVDGLGDASDEWPAMQYSQRPSPAFNITSGVVGDLPMIYCALSAVLNPAKFSVTSIAILQHSSAVLQYTLESLIENTSSLRRRLADINKLYTIQTGAGKVSTGDRPYPHPEKSFGEGMKFELQNVSFSYPGSQTTSPALRDVSFSIAPGQLVVIVGANGSGKSTIVKLLARLFEPTAGVLAIDGHPSAQYRVADLRRATAILTQDHQLYPLSLGENIGLGDPARAADAALVERAARLGGAYECITKFVGGFDTVLSAAVPPYGVNMGGDAAEPLEKVLADLNKPTAVSGGERQRIVASRTFMRFNSGKVKFVAVDEPSSALDPEGELQLFDQLREARAGKTMVFVTHRFGHLTKHADLILCMKDGALVESGTHDTLLSADGEYAKLYNIQASAFSNQGSGEPVSIDI